MQVMDILQPITGLIFPCTPNQECPVPKQSHGASDKGRLWWSCR